MPLCLTSLMMQHIQQKLHGVKLALRISWNVPHWRLIHPLIRSLIKPVFPLALKLSLVCNLHSQSILYPKYLSLDVIIILSTARCSLYESYVGNDLSWGRIIFTSPSSLSLWSLSSWNEVVGQIFILYKRIFL